MPQRIKRPTCPSCGWDGREPGEHDDWFRYLEDETRERRLELGEGGEFEVADEGELLLVDEGSRRLRCGNCLLEFRLPAGLEGLG